MPFLQNVTGISGALISVFLLAYGVATAVGSFDGGRFAHQRRPDPNRRDHRRGSVPADALPRRRDRVPRRPCCWPGACPASAWRPSLQYRTVSLAGPGGQLASSLSASAINLGIAFGSFIGGVAIGSFTASAAVLTALIIAVIAIPVAWATSYLKPPIVKQTAKPATAGQPAPEPAHAS